MFTTATSQCEPQVPSKGVGCDIAVDFRRVFSKYGSPGTPACQALGRRRKEKEIRRIKKRGGRDIDVTCTYIDYNMRAL